ncbi:XkdX family protein [Lactobacillus gasseri]|uniref:XkdX family protein n=1 Tax=Lactobacillus gasseri TaxID=1596 RepID=A0AB33C5I0_LACGS|nr:XkdX family protein [Lactobacillus gasseri]ART99153.1 XkdX family protein [Lactobacillus gasseri]
MFDTILDNLTTIQTEMIEMFKQQYEWGWFGDDKATSNAVLQGYVRTNALTPECYKEITGEDYETSVSQS